jgi:hypothetical protein
VHVRRLDKVGPDLTANATRTPGEWFRVVTDAEYDIVRTHVTRSDLFVARLRTPV